MVAVSETVLFLLLSVFGILKNVNMTSQTGFSGWEIWVLKSYFLIIISLTT